MPLVKRLLMIMRRDLSRNTDVGKFYLRIEWCFKTVIAWAGWYQSNEDLKTCSYKTSPEDYAWTFLSVSDFLNLFSDDLKVTLVASSKNNWRNKTCSCFTRLLGFVRSTPGAGSIKYQLKTPQHGSECAWLCKQHKRSNNGLRNILGYLALILNYDCFPPIKSTNKRFM